MYLFTYGTLMNGECRNSMLANEEFVCEVTIPKFVIFEYTEGGFPVAIYTGNDEDKIIGEIYDVDKSIIPFLDSVESEGYMYKQIVLTGIQSDSISEYDHVLMYAGMPKVWSKVMPKLKKWNNEERWHK